MNDEKSKNENILKATVVMLALAFCAGVVTAIIPAMWAIGHLLYAGVPLVSNTMLPGALQVLDCIMSVATFVAFTTAVYTAGMSRVHKDIIAELEKPE